MLKKPGRWTESLVTTCLAAAVAPGQGTAQTTNLIELGPPDAEVGVPFTQVVSIRELPDGRLFVADRGERRLVLIDWNGDVTGVGRVGDGPGEYRDIGWLYPLGGDSTLFTDAYNGRWHLLVGGRIVETLSVANSLVRTLGRRPGGTDNGGRVLGVQGWSSSGLPPSVPTADTLLLLRGWPEEVPPVLPSLTVPSLLGAPDGSLVLARTQGAGDHHRRYDIVDRSGRLRGWLLLPEGETLVGFGQRSAYVAAQDEWGLQTLRRHPWR